MDTKALKQKILNLAIRGKLVPQDPNDEPASVLLERIRAEKERLIQESKIKRPKKSNSSDTPHYGKIDEPFEIPENWCFVKCSDVFKKMQSVKPKEEYFTYIDIDSIDNKKNIIHPKRIKSINAPSRASRKTSQGDIVFSMVRPYLKNIAQVSEIDCIASTGFYVCSPTSYIDSSYAFKLMLSNYVVDGLNQFMKGDNSPSINSTDIDNFIIPLPPLNEQKRIAQEINQLYAFIDEIEEEKNNLENLIKTAKSKILCLATQGKIVEQDPTDEQASRLLKRINPTWKPCDTSHYEHVPEGWCVTTLNCIAESELGKTLDREKNKGDLKPYLCSLNVLWNDFNLQMIKEMKIEQDEQERYSIRKGDLLICEGGEVGRSAIWNLDKEIFYQNSIHRVRFRANMSPYYFMYLFMHLKNTGIIDSYSKGMTIKHLTKTSLTTIPLIVPPVNEQYRIAQKISELFQIMDSIFVLL